MVKYNHSSEPGRMWSSPLQQLTEAAKICAAQQASLQTEGWAYPAMRKGSSTRNAQRIIRLVLPISSDGKTIMKLMSMQEAVYNILAVEVLKNGVETAWENMKQTGANVSKQSRSVKVNTSIRKINFTPWSSIYCCSFRSNHKSPWFFS